MLQTIESGPVSLSAPATVRNGFWRHSRLDAILAACCLAQFTAVTLWLWHARDLGWGANALMVLALTYFHYYNTIVASHNAIHCPFFRDRRLNRAFGVFNSMNLLIPQSIYEAHHYVHHKHNNDPIRGGTTLDPSSTYRYGRDGRHEHVLKYCLLGIFRGTSSAYAELVRRGNLVQFRWEMAAIIVIIAAWLAVNPSAVLLGIVPMFYCSWFLTHVENYYDHYRARDADNPLANSVSYYGRIFNFLYCNEGFHQEHHMAPHVHWTERGRLSEKFSARLRDEGSPPARYISLLGFLE